MLWHGIEKEKTKRNLTSSFVISNKRDAISCSTCITSHKKQYRFSVMSHKKRATGVCEQERRPRACNHHPSPAHKGASEQKQQPPHPGNAFHALKHRRNCLVECKQHTITLSKQTLAAITGNVRLREKRELRMHLFQTLCRTNTYSHNTHYVAYSFNKSMR
jgi:hypothetical protein